MKPYKVYWLMGCLSLLVYSACTPEHPTPSKFEEVPLVEIDSSSLRNPNNLRSKRLTIERAFLQLPEQELVVEGLRGLSKIERKLLLQSGTSHRYTCTLVGNYLEIIEKADNPEDDQEQLERLTIAVYNALTRKTIVFVSQELIEEQRAEKRIIQQHFLEYEQGQWNLVNQQLPLVSTATFFEENKPPLEPQYIYFDLQATDINYLQARLQHNRYPNKDSVALKEAYKVAYIWTGDQFQLNRQAMVQYDINEHHSK